MHEYQYTAVVSPAEQQICDSSASCYTAVVGMAEPYQFSKSQPVAFVDDDSSLHDVSMCHIPVSVAC